MLVCRTRIVAPQNGRDQRQIPGIRHAAARPAAAGDPRRNHRRPPAVSFRERPNPMVPRPTACPMRPLGSVSRNFSVAPVNRRMGLDRPGGIIDLQICEQVMDLHCSSALLSMKFILPTPLRRPMTTCPVPSPRGRPNSPMECAREKYGLGEPARQYTKPLLADRPFNPLRNTGGATVPSSTC